MTSSAPSKPTRRRTGTRARRRPRPTRVAYVISRFPKLTETFVLHELLAVRAEGVEVDLYPLLREREARAHPEAEALALRARYLPFVSRPIVRTQLWYLRHRPRAYFGALAAVVRGTAGSANFLAGGLAIFPKVAHAARAMAADRVEHVHCHFANHPALAGFVVHRLEGIPYSFTAHGSDLHVDRHMLREKVADASFVVAISEFNRDVIVAECGDWARDRVRVIHCGTDIDRLRPRTKPPAGAPFNVVCVGTLHEVKGQRYLLQAVRLLVDDGVDVVCTLVGAGPDRHGLQQLAERLGVRDRLQFTGPRTHEEVVRLLAGAHVLAAPSVRTRRGKREGIPVVLMEAMAVGVPVVASRISGIPELVRHDVTGLLVAPRDARGLAAALARLQAEHAVAGRLARAGRAEVAREFDVRTNARRLVREFDAVASRA